MQKVINHAVLPLFFVLLIFTGCKKDSSNNTTVNSSLSFKVNGTQYSFSGDASNSTTTGVAITSDFGTTTTSSHYTLYCYDGSTGTSKTLLRLGFLPISGSNQLAVGTYTKTNFTCDIQITSKSYITSTTTSVTINSVSNNRYSGTFTATIKDVSNNTVSVTEGSFQNLVYIP